MRPLMDFISDGKEHSTREALDRLADHFKLTEEERKRLLPSGQQGVFTNRVAWAKTHLRMAGLIEATARGVFKITSRGQQVLSGTKDRIDLRLLQKQPGYLEARAGTREKPITNGEHEKREGGQTPEELMEESFEALRESLGHEILSKLTSSSPAFFERLVVELLGTDGIRRNSEGCWTSDWQERRRGHRWHLKEDRLGLDTIYIQAKKWQQTVSRPEIQKFAGALQGFRAKKGIFITTSDFSKEAVEYSARIDSKIVLIDGEQLWNLMIDYGIGVSTTATYEVKRIDNDYFGEEMG